MIPYPLATTRAFVTGHMSRGSKQSKHNCISSDMAEQQITVLLRFYKLESRKKVEPNRLLHLVAP
jgi:hypothetical protein